MIQKVLIVWALFLLNGQLFKSRESLLFTMQCIVFIVGVRGQLNLYQTAFSLLVLESKSSEPRVLSSVLGNQIYIVNFFFIEAAF